MIINTDNFNTASYEMFKNRRYPAIEPALNGQPRPFWSVMIPLYNPDPDYLELTLMSVLQQDAGAGNMQIELIDDCSDNFDAEAFLARFAPGRISYHRNETQLGIGDNWNMCIRRARGRWVHILHQDDVILEGFYAKIREGIKQSANIGAAFSQYYIIDSDGNCNLRTRLRQKEAGILKKWLKYIFVDMSVQTASIVVNRDVYEKIGGFSLHNQYTLDWDMWKRIAANYPIWFEPQPLACYRLHNKSTTSRLVSTGKNIKEITECIEESAALLPDAVARRVAKESKRYYSRYAVEIGLNRLLKGGDIKSTIIQFEQARKLTSRIEVAKSILIITVRGCFRFVQKMFKPKTKVNKSTIAASSHENS